MKYFESKTFTAQYRTDYLNSIHDFIKNYSDKADKNGYPLLEGKESITLRKKELLSHEDGYDIYRLFFDFNGLLLTGLLFEKNKEYPLVIMQHGYLGTPEVMSNIYEDRNSSNYSDITKRLLSFSVNVFAPQLLLWCAEYYGVEFNRLEINKTAKEKGLTLIGIETYALTSLIKYFDSLKTYKYIDMFGMSFGGLYTYYVSNYSSVPKRYTVFSYALRNNTSPTLPPPEDLKEIIFNGYNNNDMTIIIGDRDPIVDIEASNKLFKTLKNQKNIIYFHGEHEIILDDEILKGTI